VEDHVLDTMLINSFLKTYLKKRLDVTNIIINNLQFFLIKSRLPKCTSLSANVARPTQLLTSFGTKALVNWLVSRCDIWGFFGIIIFL